MFCVIRVESVPDLLPVLCYFKLLYNQLLMIILLIKHDKHSRRLIFQWEMFDLLLFSS